MLFLALMSPMLFQRVTLKRTIIGLPSPTTIYTSARQVTNFGSTQSSLLVNLYQLSAAIGCGYAGVAVV
jgi:hypothetical protein